MFRHPGPDLRTGRLAVSGLLIAGEGAFYSRDTRKTQRNNNVLVCGASGTGKTRHVVGPNIAEAKDSYVVVDPKGTLYGQYAPFLSERGYEIKKLNFANPGDRDGSGWNPFTGLLTDQDVLTFASALVAACGQRSIDPFWDQTSKIFYGALIAYLFHYTTSECHNLRSLHKLIRMASTDEHDRSEKASLDYLMEDVRRTDPDSYCLKLYDTYRLSAGRTLCSIQISTAAHSAIFDTDELDYLLSGPGISLPSIGMRKTALFVTISDMDRSLDPLVSLFFTQLFQSLVRLADGRPDGRLPVPTMLILDDFATNVVIPDFAAMISSLRSRELSVMVIIQDETQLQVRYGVEAHAIISNCDTYIFLGTGDIETAGKIAKRAGVPLADIMSMGIGEMWIFRRGERPLKTVRIQIKDKGTEPARKVTHLQAP